MSEVIERIENFEVDIIEEDGRVYLEVTWSYDGGADVRLRSLDKIADGHQEEG